MWCYVISYSLYHVAGEAVSYAVLRIHLCSLPSAVVLLLLLHSLAALIVLVPWRCRCSRHSYLLHCVWLLLRTLFSYLLLCFTVLCTSISDALLLTPCTVYYYDALLLSTSELVLVVGVSICGIHHHTQ